MSATSVIKFYRKSHMGSAITLVKTVDTIQDYRIFALLADARNETHGVEHIHPINGGVHGPNVSEAKFTAARYLDRILSGPLYYKSLYYVPREKLMDLGDPSLPFQGTPIEAFTDGMIATMVEESTLPTTSEFPDYSYLEMVRYVDIRKVLDDVTTLIADMANIYGRDNVEIHVTIFD